MLVGAADDAPKQSDLVTAVAKVDLARIAGYDAFRLTVLWQPDRSTVDEGELMQLRNAVDAATLRGVQIFLTVYPARARAAPQTPVARADYAAFTASIVRQLPEITHVIVGNEPNLDRFWQPQFTREGANAAVPAYVALLAQVYDTVKEVSAEITVIGGAISSHGADRPRAARKTQSPTGFIPAMGAAYRRMERSQPIMDALALHPYPLTARESPAKRHRGTTVGVADYGKLVRLLGAAFDGTAQPGTTLPVYYSEFGVQSRIPKKKLRFYRNRRAPAARDAVSERVQAKYYRQAIALAACQPTVVGFLLFRVADERDLKRWQSGIYYVDGTPKSSLRVVRAAIAELRHNRLRCSPAGPAYRSAAGTPTP